MGIREKAGIFLETKGETSSRDTSSSKAEGVGDRNHVPDHHDLDQAYWYVHESNNAVEPTPRELRVLRRKIDWWIVPIMFCCYTMQFIDKVLLNVCTIGSLTPSLTADQISMLPSWA